MPFIFVLYYSPVRTVCFLGSKKKNRCCEQAVYERHLPAERVTGMKFLIYSNHVSVTSVDVNKRSEFCRILCRQIRFLGACQWLVCIGNVLVCNSHSCLRINVFESCIH